MTTTQTADIALRPLFPGCETTKVVSRDGVDLADITSTEGFEGSVLVKFHGIRSFYRFPDMAAAITAACSAADHGHWYGEISAWRAK